MKLIFALLVIYQIKHFLADYPLQTKRMLGKFKPGWEFVEPLAMHCSVHALFTLAIATCVVGPGPLAANLGIFDFVVHFIMDRIKASPKMLGRYQAITKKDVEEYEKSVHNLRKSTHPECVNFVKNQDEKFKKVFKSNTFFWWSLGLDQMVHHLTHYVIIWVLVK